ADHFRIGFEAAVMKVGRVEVGVEQGRRLEGAAAADVVAAMVDEGVRRQMAGRAAHAWIVWKRFCEQHGTSARSCAGATGKSAVGPDARIGKELDVLDVSDDGIEDGRRWLGAGELVHHDVADEITQGREATIVSVRR